MKTKKTKKTEIFSEVIRIDENRQVSVTEVPHGLSIEGMTQYWDDGEKENRHSRMYLSEEAGEAMFKLLGEWMKSKTAKQQGRRLSNNIHYNLG